MLYLLLKYHIYLQQRIQIYIYYGNPYANDGQDPSNVWDSNHVSSDAWIKAQNYSLKNDLVTISDEFFDTVNGPTVNAISSSQINITPNAYDETGLATEPYLYNRNGTNITSWVSSNPYTDSGLIPNTQYTYKYKAKDRVGSISPYSSSVNKYTRASNPTNVLLTNKTTDTLTINISTAAGQGQTPQYYLQLKKKGAGASGTNADTSGWSTSTARTFTGLTSDTEYELWLTTRNGDYVSNTKYLAISSLKTNAHPNINNTTVNNQAISGNTGYTNVAVSGTVSDIDSRNILKLFYRVNGSNGDLGIQFGNNITASGTNQNFSSNLNVGSLLEGTYTLYLWVEDNKGGRSQESSRTFTVDRTSPNVNIPTITTLSSSQIKITANASDASGLAVAPYIFNKNGVDTTSWIATNPYIDTGLTPNTQYAYKYKAKDALGNMSVYSSTISKYTLAKVPTTGTIGSITENSIAASWQANSNPQGTEYALAAFDMSGTLIRQNAWTSNLSDTIASLSANTQYKLKVKARNGDNIETGWHEIGTASTLPVVPSMPQDLSATPFIDKITLTWSGSEGASKYYIYQSGSEIAQTEALTYDHLGLQEETTYTYTVKAWNEGGFSSATPELSVTTLSVPPEPPSNITTEPLANEMTVSWSPVEGATKYYIECDGQETDVGTSTSYTHKGLSPATQHTYRVKAEKSGIEGSWSASVSEYTLLEIPSNVVASATAEKVTVWWSAVEGASSYDVNIGGTIFNTTDTSYMREGLSSGDSYVYNIKAKNSTSESKWSEERTKLTLTNPPSIPQNLDGDSDITSITLTWNNVSDATGYDLEVDGKVKNMGEATTYNHTGLDPDSSHTYRVRARNSGGKSVWSDMLTVDTLNIPANVPQNLRAEETENTISIEWDTVEGASQYDLEIDESTQIRTIGAMYTHEGLESGERHTYRVRSVNDGETSDWSPVLITYTRTNLYPIPKNLTSDVDSTSITITWDEVEGVMGYDIETDGEIQEDITDTSYAHLELSPESVHTYRVRTINNGGGRGDWSEAITASTPQGLPSVPENITAIADTDKIILAWDPYPEADSYNISVRSGAAINVTDSIYIDSGLTQETEYTYKIQTVIGSEESNWSNPITVSTLSNKPPIPTNIEGAPLSTSIKLVWTLVNGATSYDVRVDGGEPISVSESEYIHLGLPSETAYTYEVRAIYIDAPGEWCDPVTVSTLPQIPSMPINVTITSGSDAITVTWDNVTGATEYDVEIDNVIEYQGTENMFTMTGLTPGTQYMVSVRARNAGGASSWTPLRTVMTRLGMPGVPENLSASSTLNTVTLTWEEVTGALSYDIRVDDATTLNVGNQITYTDTGLASGIEHSYMVRAQNVGGPGDWSSVLNKATVLNTPVVTADGRATDIIITWDLIENATFYDIEIDDLAIGRTAAAINTEVRTTTAIYTHSDLEPDTEHSYRVKAINDVSESEWSTVVTSKTKSLIQTLSCVDNEIVDIAIAANNMDQIASKAFTVVYKPSELEVVDLCSMTPEEDISIGNIEGTDICIIKNISDTQGVIVFTIDTSASSKTFEGIVNVIKFKSKINGDATVKYSVQ